MSIKEKFTRRDFILATLAATSGAAVGTTAERLSRSPNRNSINILEKHADYLKAIEDRIVVKNDSLPLTIVDEKTGEKKVVKVSVNKKTFSQEILRIAEMENPKQGLSKTLSFLEKKPLEIQLLSELPPLRTYSLGQFLGQTFVEMAHYEPILIGGPGISFFSAYLEGYYNVVNMNDIRRQPDYDYIPWHEIYHLYQDIRNPYTTGLVLILSSVDEFALKHKLPQKLTLLQIVTEKVDIPLFRLVNTGAKLIKDSYLDYAHEINFSFENEALEKPFQMATDLRVNEMLYDLGKTKEKSEYTFGQFFTFEEVEK